MSVPRRFSQREARRLYKRVDQLVQLEADRNSRWRREYPGGVHLVNCPLGDASQGRLFGATAMGAALVAKLDGSTLMVYAVPRG